MGTLFVNILSAMLEMILALLPDPPNWAAMFTQGGVEIPGFGYIQDPVVGIIQMASTFNNFLPVAEFAVVLATYWTVRLVVVVVKVIRRMAWN